MLKPATLLKLTLLHGCFSRFLNCTNSNKSPNAPHMWYLRHPGWNVKNFILDVTQGSVDSSAPYFDFADQMFLILWDISLTWIYLRSRCISPWASLKFFSRWIILSRQRSNSCRTRLCWSVFQSKGVDFTSVIPSINHQWIFHQIILNSSNKYHIKN